MQNNIKIFIINKTCSVFVTLVLTHFHAFLLYLEINTITHIGKQLATSIQLLVY